jgi:hypothetical protein
MLSTELERLLVELEVLLTQHGEQNWVRGVVNARNALSGPGGVDETKSIYRSMCQENGSLSDYYIHHDDFETRAALNTSLDPPSGTHPDESLFCLSLQVHYPKVSPNQPQE